MTADAAVGGGLGGTLTRAEAGAQIDRFQAAEGVAPEPGFLAVERAADGGFLGAAALRKVYPDHPMAGSVELAWRLARTAWSQGYATEAGRMPIAFGIERPQLKEIVAFTAVGNLRSRAVMGRLGMTRRADLDFHHPALAPDHPLRPHVPYLVARPN